MFHKKYDLIVPSTGLIDHTLLLPQIMIFGQIWLWNIHDPILIKRIEVEKLLSQINSREDGYKKLLNRIIVEWSSLL